METEKKVHLGKEGEVKSRKTNQKEISSVLFS